VARVQVLWVDAEKGMTREMAQRVEWMVELNEAKKEEQATVRRLLF
jgi:hypothetical protein